MIRASHLPFALALTLTCAAAQNPIAFPQDSTGTSSGNLVPLGFLKGSGTSDEGRYQQLIPARNLPSTAGLITGMAVFTIPGTGQVNYESLKITLAHTTRTALDSTFANNLTGPVVVYDKTRVALTYRQSTWTDIVFTTPFVYDGTRNLVVEFQKVLDSSTQPLTIVSHGTSSNPGRRDTPRSAYEFGLYQSGASKATTARFFSSTFKLRLLFTGDTLVVKSDRLNGNGSVFALGGTVELTNYGAGGRPFANLVSVGFGNPVPLFGGQIYLGTPRIFLNSGVIPNSGSSTLTFTIPNLQSLQGAHIVAQGATADPGGAGTRVTCAVDFIVN